jgi:predicted Zn finger-like uncharacterized protein
MIVECSGCNTIFPVDPNKVPDGGIHARCSVCSEVFFVRVSEGQEEPVEAQAVEAPVEEAVATDQPGADTHEAPIEDAEFEVEVVTPEPIEAEAAEEEMEPFEDPAPVVEEAEPAFEGADVVVEDPPQPEAAAESKPPLGFQEPTFGAMEDVGSGTETPPVSAPLFGKRDPMEKAQRLARVLVSDIILYNPDRHHSATESGRVKEEFEEEIQKSWNEYVEQVGEEVANTTSYFNDALNEILAKGEKIF